MKGRGNDMRWLASNLTEGSRQVAKGRMRVRKELARPFLTGHQQVRLMQIGTKLEEAEKALLDASVAWEDVMEARGEYKR